ncbi:MAG TPA: GTPase HflX [Thermoplasmatales archaeon]|nr:GTPase HflX [Thermoplasmatales archaeon]HEX16825.1 GTPase HflX [Thermoplasmatales archaeon]
MLALARTLDYEIVKIFFQKRDKPDVRTFIGRGKVEEIKEFLNSNRDIDLVIIDGELKPSQWFNLEKEFGKEVYDRLRLILSIFEKRAESREAKLQVRLAQLRYERPFVRELIHRSRAGEHPGYMAGGEYQVDDYYEMIKRQMRKIRKELEKIREDREIRRKQRREIGFYLIAIAGYTNAGKSSLLNLLANENVKVEELLFSTLSTTTSRIRERMSFSRPPILLTDTVGFIRNLPSWVIDAFHSTLEEIEVADLILLIVDLSEEPDEVRSKLQASLKELREIGAGSNILVVFNKIDVLDEDEVRRRLDHLKDLINDLPSVEISVKERKNIDKLIEMISRHLPSPVSLRFILPNTPESHKFLSELFERTWIRNVEYGEKIVVDLSVNPRISDKIIHRCKEIGGEVYHK